MNPSDGELVERARLGDRASFEMLVRRYQDPIHNLALRMLDDSDEAADVAQEAFVEAYRGLHRFHGESAFSTWLYRIAVNLCLNRRSRWLWRWRNRSVPLDATQLRGRPGALPSAVIDDPETAACREQQRRRVREALSRLGPEQRAILVLREIQGLSYGELAVTLQINEGTVKSRLSRARQALRAELGDQER